MAGAGVSDQGGDEVEAPERNSWEYHSVQYGSDELVAQNLHTCFSHRPYWQRMSRFKAFQMDALPPFIWLKTGFTMCKFKQILIPGMPPMCFCYQRGREYTFIRPIAAKVMQVEHRMTDDGLIAVQFMNAFTGNADVEAHFHPTERLIDAQDVAVRVLRRQGLVSNNTEIKIIPKMALTRQLRNIFNVRAVRGPTVRARRRKTKKTPSYEATSSSFKTCACSGCAGLRKLLLDSRDDYTPLDFGSSDGEGPEV